MGLDGLRKGINETLRAAAIAGALAGPVAAQERKDPPEPPRAEESQTPNINRDIPLPLPERYFKIDDFVAATEGTAEERKKLAEELFVRVLEHGQDVPNYEDSKEMLFPLELSGEEVSVRVLIRPLGKWMRVLIFRGDVTPVSLTDSTISGTPSSHQTPIDEKGLVRPQGFEIPVEDPLANRIYLGILRQLLSKF